MWNAGRPRWRRPCFAGLMTEDDIPVGLRRELIASMDLLIAAGVIAGHSFRADPDHGQIILTEAAATLLRAGRRIDLEPAFQKLFIGGDPAEVRRWIEAEAASIDRSSSAESGRSEDRPDHGA